MNELKKQRIMNGWTRSFVSNKVNISVSLLEKMENDERNGSKNTMKKLAKIYQMSVDSLFFGDSTHSK